MYQPSAPLLTHSNAFRPQFLNSERFKPLEIDPLYFPHTLPPPWPGLCRRKYIPSDACRIWGVQLTLIRCLLRLENMLDLYAANLCKLHVCSMSPMCATTSAKPDFSHVDRHSSSPDIIVSHSYMPSLARCPSTPQHPTVLCGCKLILCSSTETWAVTIGCYRGASTFYPALIGS